MNAVVEKPFTAGNLPAIGAEIAGGKFAGISLYKGERVGLILLPDNGGDRPHAAALEWAKGLDADLPTRIDMCVLYENAREEFEDEWHWTSETHPRYADYAWCQGFGDGNQDLDRKSYGYRCRAVRRVAI
jgi:hypothetical protein